MLAWMCWWTLLVAAGIGGKIANWHVKKSSDESCLENNKKIILECLKQRQIVHIPTFECFEVNSQGGCDVGERIVVMEKSECGATKCVENKSADGKPCPEGLLAYNGQCEISGSKRVCQNKGLGKRLTGDLYGTVACRCAVDLGYVDVNGSCYHEYFRGPCQEGEQILRDGTQKWKCVRHYCKQGQVQWADGRCYDYEATKAPCDDMYVLKTKNGEETVEVAEDQNVEDLLILSCKSAETRSGTFDNCVARRKNSDECLATGRIPQVGMQDLNTFLRNLLSTINIEKH
eukprot:TRINITY_DN6567_c0_g1_i2.p1 TRINITY_DN6567_c0_g1~~TRINITY_DN6567_c0_g1_i2.p1  ORF type:complete len:288 (-),score=50.71 TRINITY_DN6567_c0_g1_i2:69-932(-)